MRGYNRLFLMALANLLHNDAVARMVTKNNNIKVRLLAVIPFWIKVYFLAIFVTGFYFNGFIGYE